MKSKRFLSLFVALVMALSLAVPAFAAEEPETDDGYITVDVQDLLDAWEGVDPDYLEVMPITAAYDSQYEEYDWIADEARAVEEYRAEHPGELEALDINELLAEHGYLEPLAAYMENYGYETEEQAKIGVLYDYIQSVQYTEEPDWDWSDWDWVYERPELTLVVGGETQWESSIYAENGVSYLPAAELNAILGTSLTGDNLAIRDAAVAAGWDVTWNSYNNEVVLLNRETALAGYDFSKFDALMNALLAASKTEAGQSYKTTETCDVTVTLFNSLDGDQTQTLTLTAESLVKDNVMDITITANAAQLLDLVPKATLTAMTEELPNYTVQNLKTLLTGCKAQLIWNLDEGMLYWNAPILSIVDSEITENTWFVVDMGYVYDDETMTMVETLLEGGWDTAEFLYQSLLSDSETAWSGAEGTYEQFTEATGLLNLLLGKNTVTEKNGALTWKLDGGVLDKVLAEYTSSDTIKVSEMFKELEMSISVDNSGKMSVSAAIRPDMDGITAALYDLAYGFGMDYSVASLAYQLADVTDFRYAVKAEGTAEKSIGELEFHLKNQVKVELKTASTRKATTDTPRTAPPAGAELLEL